MIVISTSHHKGNENAQANDQSKEAAFYLCVAMNNPSFRSRNSSGLGHTKRLHKHVCKRCSSWTTAASTKWHMKRHIFFCAVSFPPNASAAGETPLLSPKPFRSRATAVRYGFPSDSGSDPPRDRNLYVHIYIYIMIYHDILYNISIVFMGFINQLMMPNAYFWMMLVSQCHFNYSHEHHINFPWQSVAFLRWGTQELWPHVLDGAEECDTEPGISPSSQNRGI